MDNYIKRIYDMMYSPIVTPYNLLENAKLDNYAYVKYYKSTEGLIAEMKCEIPDEGTRIFRYFFDNKDYLLKVSMTHNDTIEIVFDRNSAINEAKQDYYALKSDYAKAI